MPRDVPDPTELHYIGTASNEVELVRLYSAHIKEYDPVDHRPWVFVLPQEVPKFSTWLQAHGLEREMRHKYLDEYHAACREYMDEIGEPSIFRMPQHHRH